MLGAIWEHQSSRDQIVIFLGSYDQPRLTSCCDSVKAVADRQRAIRLITIAVVSDSSLPMTSTLTSFALLVSGQPSA
jgi:hypothetical protein